MTSTPKNESSSETRCGIFCISFKYCQRFANIEIFVALMCAVIAVQGLGMAPYPVTKKVTSVEKGITDKVMTIFCHLQLLLTLHIVLPHVKVGKLLFAKHRWTGAGVILSALSMCFITAPHFIFGNNYHNSQGHSVLEFKKYIEDTRCDVNRAEYPGNPGYKCHDHAEEDLGAYALMVVGQLLAGAAAAPFNTLAYVYIDDNVHPRKSPLYLGLLTGMYAFGPALGFTLAAICNSIYVEPFNAPKSMQLSSPEWIGCWWLGFVICAILYLLLALPLLAFPKKMTKTANGTVNGAVNGRDVHEMQNLNPETQTATTDATELTCWQSMLLAIKVMPSSTWSLLKNPVYTSMVLGWIFGSYLIGGYATYLPKYIETQYAQGASIADLMAVAVSTALGGFILTKLNWPVSKAIAALCCCWSVIVLTYLLGMAVGCPHEDLQGVQVEDNRWNFTQSCNLNCHCMSVIEFQPVCTQGKSYFSPCHAGCKYYDFDVDEWGQCMCGLDEDLSMILDEVRAGRHAEATETAFWHKLKAQSGMCQNDCWHLPLYIIIMFIGLFIGNLFFMTTMMTVLRCVQDHEKSLSLSFASCATNIIGFIPAPIIFGALIDTSCVVWHSLCPYESGNCIVYNNNDFKIKYHLGNTVFQLIAVLSVLFCYFKSRKFNFPEDTYYEENVIAECETRSPVSVL